MANGAVVGALALWAACCAAGADPTFLRRSVVDIAPQSDDLTTGAKGVSYQPIFGAGDKQASQSKSVARYGALTVEPNGASAVVSYPAEEQIYFVLAGKATLIYGDQRAPIRRNDFMYLPVGLKHGIANASGGPVRLLVMGFRIPRGTPVAPTPQLLLANADDVAFVPVEGHGQTVLFKLLMGTTASRRDKLAAASRMVSLFIMDFAPGGTTSRTTTPWRKRFITSCAAMAIWSPAAARWQRGPLSGQRRRRVFHSVECHGRILQRVRRRRPRPGTGGPLALPVRETGHIAVQGM